MGVIDIISKMGKDLGKNLQRKAKKPMSHYQAIEKAHQVIEDHTTSPVRAPMNVPKIKFSKEHSEFSEVMADEKLKRSDEILKKMENVKVVSTDPDFDGPGLRPSVDKSRLPAKPNFNKLDAATMKDLPAPIPRGLVNIRDMVDIMSNHARDPQTWHAQAIADKFTLRPDDVAKLLENFALLRPEDFKDVVSDQDLERSLDPLRLK